jgi:hypothetical protein
VSSVAVAALRISGLASELRATTDSSRSSFESGSSPRAAASFIASGAAPDLMASRIWLLMVLLYRVDCGFRCSKGRRGLVFEEQITIGRVAIQLFVWSTRAAGINGDRD